jgi:hypothetical protein
LAESAKMLGAVACNGLCRSDGLKLLKTIDTKGNSAVFSEVCDSLKKYLGYYDDTAKEVFWFLEEKLYEVNKLDCNEVSLKKGFDVYKYCFETGKHWKMALSSLDKYLPYSNSSAKEKLEINAVSLFETLLIKNKETMNDPKVISKFENNLRKTNRYYAGQAYMNVIRELINNSETAELGCKFLNKALENSVTKRSAGDMFFGYCNVEKLRDILFKNIDLKTDSSSIFEEYLEKIITAIEKSPPMRGFSEETYPVGIFDKLTKTIITDKMNLLMRGFPEETYTVGIFNKFEEISETVRDEFNMYMIGDYKRFLLHSDTQEKAFGYVMKDLSSKNNHVREKSLLLICDVLENEQQAKTKELLKIKITGEFEKLATMPLIGAVKTNSEIQALQQAFVEKESALMSLIENKTIKQGTLKEALEKYFKSRDALVDAVLKVNCDERHQLARDFPGSKTSCER